MSKRKGRREKSKGKKKKKRTRERPLPFLDPKANVLTMPLLQMNDVDNKVSVAQMIMTVKLRSRQ